MTAYALKVPLTTADGGTIVSVQLKSTIKVRDMKKVAKARADGDEMDATIALVSAYTGLEVALVEDMDARDFTAISEKVADFFQAE